MKNLAFNSFLVLLICLSVKVNAQENGGILKGKIVLTNNLPASFVNVSLQKNKNQTIADQNGNFIFKQLPNLSDTILITGIGLKSKKQFIQISNNDYKEINIKIDFDINLLQNVEIFGRNAQSYKSDYSFATSKTKASISEIPQSVSTVTKELVDDKMQMHLTDALENVSGVTHYSGYEEYNIRGLHAENARLINGLRTFNTTLTSPLLVNIERVEVIKGPTSVLYGNCDPGGTINLVTKKPLNGSHFAASIGKGTWNAYNGQIDATGQINNEKTLLYRLNTGYEQKESFRNGYFLKSFQVAPSLTFIPNNHLQINLDVSFSNTNSVVDRGQPALEDNDNLLSTPIQLSLIQPSDYLKETNFSAVLSATYQFNNKLSFNSSLLRYQTNQKLSEHNIEDFITDDSLNLSYNYRHVKSSTNTFTNYFSYLIDHGDVKQQLIFGYDYISNKLSANEWEGELPNFGVNNRIVGTFSLIHPEYISRNVNQYNQIIDSAGGEEIANGVYTTHGIYFQDHLTFKKWQLIAGIRGEFFQSGTEQDNITRVNKLIPKIGINYAIDRNYHIYANYHNGFDPFEPSSVLQVFNQPFKPVTSNMFETGIKADLFRNQLFASLAIYQITINNLAVNANDVNNPNLYVQRGIQQSKGLEIEMQGNINTNLSVFTGYSYNQTEIIKSIKSEEVGKIAENAPKHSSNSWIKYRFTNSTLNGLSIALGHTQVGQRNTLDKDVTLPGYVLFNASINYQIKHFKLAFNLNNIFNKVYWTSAYNNTNKWPGSPRNSMFRIYYTF
jgi:iron complex outermembrane receptor protein